MYDLSVAQRCAGHRELNHRLLEEMMDPESPQEHQTATYRKQKALEWKTEMSSASVDRTSAKTIVRGLMWMSGAGWSFLSMFGNCLYMHQEN